MALLPLANIGSRKLRTGISMLAIGVGVALFLVLVGLTSTLGEIADRTVNVDAHMMVWPNADQVVLSGGLPAEKAEADFASIPGVERAIPVLRWPVRMGGKIQNVMAIRPADWRFFRRGEGRLVAGRPIEGGFEMVIDTRLQAALRREAGRDDGFGPGDAVRRGPHTFTIVGVAREGVAGRVFMPIETVSAILDQPRLRASFFYLRLDGPASVGPVREAVAARGLKPIAFDEYYDVLATSFVDMDLVIGAVVFVAGFVCFLVILLTVFTMVVERTREIGILRGIGASRAQVFGLVMAEAGLICAGGVAVGFALTVGGRALVLHLQPLWTITIPAVRYALAAALAAGGTALGALYPAARAARLDPVECLRYE